MEGSKIGQDWRHISDVDASLKSVSSMKLLRRDLGMSSPVVPGRIGARAALSKDSAMFHGPVEVDETSFGDQTQEHEQRDAIAGTGREPVGKTAVIGRPADQARRGPRHRTHRRPDVAGLCHRHVEPEATVYTDDATGYDGMPFNHATVKHSLSEYVKGEVHTNGIESLWSMLKRAHTGTFHKLSPKHLDRYVQEFAGRHNVREQDTIEQMRAVTAGMDGKRLTYERLIEANGLASGARA